MDLGETILQTQFPVPELNENNIKNAFECVPQIRKNIYNHAQERTLLKPARDSFGEDGPLGAQHLHARPAHHPPPLPGHLPGRTPTKLGSSQLVSEISALYLDSYP